MSTRVDKPREYFSKLLDVPEAEINYREIPATTAADWDDAEVLLPVTQSEFRAIERFIWTHRPEEMTPSPTYNLFAEAIKNQKQITCTYNGHHRELCPIILGHKDGQEKALTYRLLATAKKDSQAEASGAACFCPGFAMFNSEMGLGTAATAILSRRAASKSLTSM
jgi:hypothetical protein